MNTKDVIYELRTKNGMSQDELAERIHVTRQAVSRWENGDTVPNTETLKLLSQLFNVSINTLLGSPRQLICQCCGMPLDDTIIGTDKDGALNESYCKWCYADGQYTYSDMDELIDESNALHINGMPKVERLNALVGSYVNLAYPLPSGISAKFLDDRTTYLGNQLKSEFGDHAGPERCFGVLANMDFILVCTYEADGKDPELILYKKR